ncbi:MAG: GNAT family N-acetyltransferase [Pyrinomonadaceae bacterium]
MSLALRPVSLADQPFLFQVYASTRAEEMAVVPWSEDQKQAFLQMQFNAQSQSYQQQFPGAEYSVILYDGVPAGRLTVERTDESILLIDIALLPAHRNMGIGSSLIDDLKTEAQESGRPLRLDVENFNPAYRLYERLGFKKIDEASFYYRMEWRPSETATAV